MTLPASNPPTVSRSRLSRRRLAQGMAAAPLAFGAASLLPGRSLRPVVAQDKKRVTFWSHTHPPMVEQNEAMVTSFMEENPGIEIAYEIIPNMSFAEKMLASMSTGTGPDLINMDDNQMRSIYIPNGLVAEVDPASAGYGSVEEMQAAYIGGAFEGATVDGKVYGLPSEFNVTAFAINTEAFEQAGLDPNSPPKTWEEVGTMGQELVQREGETLTRLGFDFLYLHAGWYHNQLGTLLLQTGGRWVAEDGTTAAINSPESVAALQIWYDMVYKYKIADPNFSSREATVPYQDFIDGKVAMTLMNPWGLGLITEESAVYGKVAIVPLPQVDPAKPVTPLYAYYWAVNALSEVKPEAFTFASYLASDPGAWLENVDFIQPKTDWASLPEISTLEFSDVWAEQMTKGKFLPVNDNSQEVDNIVKSAIENSILNDVPPQEALDLAAEEINAVLAG